MNKLNLNNTVLPILAVIALCVGNYLRLGETEVQTLQDALFGVATAIATIYGIYGVWKDKNPKDPTNKQK